MVAGTWEGPCKENLSAWFEADQNHSFKFHSSLLMKFYFRILQIHWLLAEKTEVSARELLFDSSVLLMLWFQRHAGDVLLHQEAGSLSVWETVLAGLHLWNRGHELASKEGLKKKRTKTLLTSELEQDRISRHFEPGLGREINFCGGKPHAT